jgi:Bacterial toxin 28
MPTVTMNPFAPGRAVPPGDPELLRRAAEAFTAAADTLSAAGARAAAASAVAPDDWSGQAAGQFTVTCGTAQARVVYGGAVLRTAAGALYTLAAELEAAIGAARDAQARADELAEASFRVQREMDWARGPALAALDARADALRDEGRQVERATEAAFDRAAVASELAAAVFDQVAAAAYAACELESGQGEGSVAGSGTPLAGLDGVGVTGAMPMVGFVMPVPGGLLPGAGARVVPVPGAGGSGGAAAGALAARPMGRLGVGVRVVPRPAQEGADPAKSVHTIKEHVTPRDLSAARMELLGVTVVRKLGGDPYDHVREVRGAQRALLDRIKAIKKRMAHPGLPHHEHGALTAELGEASRLLDRTESFVPRPTR